MAQITTKTTAELSTDIHVITAEINAYQRVAGEAIFEIGRRLKHVKENDLAHGEFMAWYESIGLSKDFVSKAITIADNLSNFETSRNIGIEALYQIATLPPEERERPHTIPSTGETKTVDEMTVRELREVKKALREAEERVKKAEKERDEVREYSQEKIQRYEELFGDVSMYDGRITRTTNGDAVTYAAFEFSENVRKFIEKFGYLSHFAYEFGNMIDEGREMYGNAIYDMQRFLSALEKNLNPKKIIDVEVE